MQMWRNKRALSESDCEQDLYLDEHSNKDCSSPGEGLNESCGTSSTGGNMTRKRRRGIIEKRRRDRINHSLSELRRLVPSAFEKQGSAKLEKAEILQLTVDHLKMLHAKGLDALAYDPHKFAMDYHNIGFRECTAEVARYLVSVEGMDVQDPLRLRLMSHLQCFAAQRELSNKPVTAGGGSSVASGVVTSPVSSAATPSSAINTPAPSNAWPFPPTPGSYGGGHNVNSVQHHNFNNHPATSSSSGGQQNGTPGPSSVFDQSAHHYGMDMSNSFGHPAAANAARLHHHTAMPHHHHHQTGTTMTTLQPVQPGHPHHPATASYPHVNHHPFPTLATQNGGYTTSGNQVRPYRPWGAELVY
uniref:Hairy/enhancer-of-split related with YRPW motif protein n=1 Tax=Daphnia galeata TaxID=27404 RepID=A0A8J2RJB2_9CRUS|nr:unnamed protein product [Daphnia galeata]